MKKTTKRILGALAILAAFTFISCQSDDGGNSDSDSPKVEQSGTTDEGGTGSDSSGTGTTDAEQPGTSDEGGTGSDSSNTDTPDVELPGTPGGTSNPNDIFAGKTFYDDDDEKVKKFEFSGNGAMTLYYNDADQYNQEEWSKSREYYYSIGDNNSANFVTKAVYLNEKAYSYSEALELTNSFDENYFDEIDSDGKAYWLGFLMADGYITTKRPNKGNENQSFGCTLSVKDITHLEKFRDSLKSNHPIHIYKKNSSNFERGQDTCRLLIGNQHTVDSLKKLGIVENKTFFCKMPNIKEEYKLSFIRGYSDGDGSLYIDKRGRFGWSLTGTKELLQEILKVLGKSELKMEQRWPERENNNWSVTILGKVQVPMLLDKIYENATVYLDRKYEVYLKMKAWHKNNPHKNYKYY